MTVTNSVRAFGGGPSSLWNAYNWNAFKWGDGTVKIPDRITKQISNSLTPDSARYFRFVHLVAVDPLTVDSARFVRFKKLIANEISPTGDSTGQYVFDAAGYYHVQPGGTTNNNDRVDSTWAAATRTAPVWAAGTASSTTWSAA